jgi:hypothetical protein
MGRMTSNKAIAMESARSRIIRRLRRGGEGALPPSTPAAEGDDGHLGKEPADVGIDVAGARDRAIIRVLEMFLLEGSERRLRNLHRCVAHD